MQLKQDALSSTGVERLFECLPHDREASRRLWSKAFGSSRRFSAWLARTSWGAKLQQNRRHHATHLLWRHGTIAALPRPVQGLSELACQIQLVQDQSHQPAPAFELSRGTHMHPRPKQFLLKKAIAVLLGETARIVRSHLRQRHDRIKHHEPTHARVPLAAFGRFALDLDHGEVQLPVLLKMQVVPAADLDLATRSRLLAEHLIGASLGLGAFALKERTIFGRGAAPMRAHRDAIELAIAL